MLLGPDEPDLLLATSSGRAIHPSNPEGPDRLLALSFPRFGMGALLRVREF
jgi:hypothetical protein